MADEVIELGSIRIGGGEIMAKSKGGTLAGGRAANRAVGRTVDSLARRHAAMSGSHGFGNFSRQDLGRFGQQSMLGGLIPAQAKPVPVILGTVVGVGVNSAASRLLESPKVGINANPLLSRVLLTGAGILTHVMFKKDFTLGFMVGQFPGLVDAGVSALMDMALGETTGMEGVRGADMGRMSRQALAELQALRRQLESAGAPAQGQSSQLPMGMRAQAA